ncbi:mRNA cleavage and polyadenylation factor subunit [Balamuthia mandrillaris]
MSYLFYQETVPPTGVEHCLVAHFTGVDDLNLLVAKTHVLEVYRLVPTTSSSITEENSPSSPSEKGEESEGHVLELVAAYHLFGNIESLAAVRFARSKKDAILVTFRDAKISVVEFASAEQDLRVVSLHSYERNRIKEGHEQCEYPPQALVDTQQRCAVMLAYSRKLVVLPFRSATSDLLEEELVEGETNAPVRSSIVIDPLDMGVGNIKDLAFLHGYYEPTLLVLHEPNETWIGRYALARNTCIVSAVSLNLSQQSHPRIWSVEHLPHDCYKLVSVPEAVGGGALVFSTNVLYYFNQSMRYGVALNSYATASTVDEAEGAADLPFPLTQSKITLTLDAVHNAWITPKQLLVSLKDGGLYIFHMLTDGRSVQSIEITKAGSSVLTSCMCTMELSNDNNKEKEQEQEPKRFLFLGSRLGDSLLIRYTEQQQQPQSEQQQSNTSTSISSSSSQPTNDSDMTEEDRALYFGTVSASSPSSSSSSKNKRNDNNSDDYYDDEIYNQFNRQRRYEGIAAEGEVIASIQEEGEEAEANNNEAERSGVNQSFVEEMDPWAIFGGKESINKEQATKLTTYRFRVCDSLVNIGPIADFSVGESFDPASISITDYEQQTKQEIEFVTCSGHGRNGALSILQYGIRPELIHASSELPSCQAMWTLSCLSSPSNDDVDEGRAEELLMEAYHSYLVLSREDKTIVLASGEQLDEISNRVDVNVGGPTLAVGNLFAGTTIAQVHPNGVILLNAELQAMQRISLREDVLDCSILDPWVLLVMADHSLRLYGAQNVKSGSNTSNLIMRKMLVQAPNPVPILAGEKTTDTIRAPPPKLPQITSVHLFKGNFNGSVGRHRQPKEIYCALSLDNGYLQIYSIPEFKLVFECPGLDNGDALLRNHLLPSYPPPSSFASSSSSSPTSASLTRQKSGKKKDEETKTTTSTATTTIHLPTAHVPRIVEIAVVSGQKPFPSSPFLLVLLESEELFVYRSFTAPVDCNHPLASDFLPVRWKRVPHDLPPQPPLSSSTTSSLLSSFSSLDKGKQKEGKGEGEEEKNEEREYGGVLDDEEHQQEQQKQEERGQKKSKAKRKREAEEEELDEEHDKTNKIEDKEEQEETKKDTKRLKRTESSESSIDDNNNRPIRHPHRRLLPFSNIGGKEGVFVAGKISGWALWHRGYLRFFPMKLDPVVLCFTEFHNAYCPHGFMYINDTETLKICQLSSNVQLDTTWPLRKVPLRCTPHHIAYHSQSRTYAISVSNSIKKALPKRRRRQNDGNDEEEEQEEVEEVEEDPRAVPFSEDRYEVRLVSPTNWKILDRYVLDEHEQLLTLKVLKLVDNLSPTKKQPRLYVVVGTATQSGDEENRDYKFRHLYSTAMKGPVSAAAALQGYLALGIGPKIIVFNFDGSILEGTSFYDAQHLLVNLCTIKNYMLCGDIYKSVFFLRWRETGHVLSLLAKDPGYLSVFATEFVVDKNQLSILVADEKKNVQALMYAPQSVESRGGDRLVPRGDFHVGAHINKFLRVNMQLHGGALRQQAVWFGTLDGGKGYFAPIDELVFRRLAMLQTRLTTGMPHTCGLNPKSFRLLRKETLLHNQKHTILDGTLLARYLHLPGSQQSLLAKQVGTTREKVLNDMLSIHRSATHHF